MPAARLPHQEASCMLALRPLLSPWASHTPAWAFRVPRPEGDGFRMTARLQGVPKPMLQTIFGKALGLRIWEQARRESTHPADSPTNQVADSEISTGMVNYVSLRTAGTLRERSRQAKAITIDSHLPEWGVARRADASGHADQRGQRAGGSRNRVARRFSRCAIVDLTVTA